MTEQDLFLKKQSSVAGPKPPLAVRMRPQSLDEYVGQQHIVGPGQLLRRTIEADRMTSVILYGPPGTGKTALAHIVAKTTQAYFEPINATAAGVSELRDVIVRTKERVRINHRRTILFIDEIHRFNRSQQDVLMPDVEAGNPILIGATTANPFFSLVSALLSRSVVCELRPLTVSEIFSLLQRALNDSQRGLGDLRIDTDVEALEHLAKVCDGDARRALNALEVAVLTTPMNNQGKIPLTLESVESSIQKKAVQYDQAGDAHYDTASAFIKSMRGSDPHAALYWLAKMLYAGEDPRFIARRIVICAAEDVGNADPQALVVATAALQASEFVGLPECRIPLAQAVTYIATAPKSNAAYKGLEKAAQEVREGRTLEVPVSLRDASYKGAKRLGHGQGYKYAHNYRDHYVEQEYIPTASIYYEPSDQGFERTLKERMERRRKQSA